MKKDSNGSSLGVLRGVAAGVALGVSCLPILAFAASQENEALFKQGMQALEDDRLTTAIESFHSILSNQPSLHRARLELAVAYYRAYKFDEAEKLAQQVLDDSATPPEVRVTILAFLAQVKQDKAAAAVRHQFKPSVGLGYMYDSNVNVGPSTDVVQLGDQTLTLLPGSTERSDNATIFNLDLRHRYQPGKTFEVGQRTAVFLWQNELSLYHREYSSEDEFNLTVLSASTGPAWVVLRHWRANIDFRADYIWLSNSELGIFTSLNPAVTWQFTDGELTLDAYITDRDYEDGRPVSEGGDGGREGTYIAAGPSLGRYFNQRKVAAQIGMRLIDFNADAERFAYDGYELYAGVNVKTWEGGSVYGRTALRDVDYEGFEPGFGQSRDEQEKRFAIGFRHEFKDGAWDKWAIGGDIQYTNNDSNISIYDYDRRQIQLNVGRTF